MTREPNMHLPELPHLQLFVLLVLNDKGHRLSGQQIRDRLAECGYQKSLPAFYQMMRKLTDAGYVTEPQYEQSIIAGYMVTQAYYEITAIGAKACEKAVGFYEPWIPKRAFQHA